MIFVPNKLPSLCFVDSQEFAVIPSKQNCLHPSETTQRKIHVIAIEFVLQSKVASCVNHISTSF